MAGAAIIKKWGGHYFSFLHSSRSVTCACVYTADLVSGLDKNAVVKKQVSGNSPSTKPMLVAA